MKAGIYKTPNGNYVYVAKDRTIMATTLAPSGWPGHRVRTSEKEQLVHFFDVTAERVSDVPNGTTDHQAALQAYVDSLSTVVIDFETREMAQNQGVDPYNIEGSNLEHFLRGGDRRVARPPALGAGYGTVTTRDGKLIGHLSAPAEIKPCDALGRYPGLMTPLGGDADAALEHLGTHPPAVPSEEHAPAERASDAFVERTAAQLEIVNDFARSVRDVQVMYLAEQRGLAEWRGDRWHTLDGEELTELLANPPKVLPVLPAGFFAGRCGLPKGAGKTGFRSGGVVNAAHLTGGEVAARLSPPFELFMSPFEEATAAPEAIRERERLVDRVVFVENPPRENLVQGTARTIEQMMRQSTHAMHRELEERARITLAEILGIIEVHQDEIVVLDSERWATFSSDVRRARYQWRANWRLHDRDTNTDYQLTREQYEAAYARANPRIEFVDSRTGEKMDRLGRAFDFGPRPLVAKFAPRFKTPEEFGVNISGPKMPKALKRHGVTGVISDDPAECAAIMAIARGEIRLIGKQSKRKHKRAGHRVFWCAPMGSWAWEVNA